MDSLGSEHGEAERRSLSSASAPRRPEARRRRKRRPRIRPTPSRSTRANTSCAGSRIISRRRTIGAASSRPKSKRSAPTAPASTPLSSTPMPRCRQPKRDHRARETARHGARPRGGDRPHARRPAHADRRNPRRLAADGPQSAARGPGQPEDMLGAFIRRCCSATSCPNCAARPRRWRAISPISRHAQSDRRGTRQARR